MKSGGGGQNHKSKKSWGSNGPLAPLVLPPMGSLGPLPSQKKDEDEEF